MIPRLHSRDNKEITPDEKVVLATMIKMSKVLKLQRGDHHFYPPQRLVIKNYTSPAITGSKLDFIITAPIKFVQLLHPTKTMVQAEYVNMDESGDDPFHFTISLPDIPSAKDWVDEFGYDTDDGNTGVVASQPSSYIWSGLSTKNDNQYYYYPSYQHAINTNEVGFPITDTQYLNNNQIRIRVQSRDVISLQNKTTLDLTLVFYTFSGGED
jgi:hypothetical protein